MPPLRLIDFEEALSIVLSGAVPLGTETVALPDTEGRVLADAARSDMDMPPFDKAAMDGFAYNSADPGPTYRIMQTIPAGKAPGAVLAPGTCMRIMTGAPVPSGADRVVRVEYTTVADECMTINREERSANICVRAEDVRTGDVLAERSTRINPAVIGILASIGMVQVPVFRRARVGIIATGTEIVEPDRVPGPGCIRNSNSYQLCAQVAACGGIPTYYGIAADTEEQIRPRFLEAAAANDIVLLSGGVSMGDFDLVPGMLETAGTEIIFESIKVKPGKPTVFGRCGDAFVFGLPGNPVSTLVIFELLVRPLISALMGHTYTPLSIPAALQKPIKVKTSGRISFLPAVIHPDGMASLLDYHGSAHLAAYAGADGLIRINPGSGDLAQGTIVNVRSFRS